MPPKNDPKKIEAERLSGFLQELLREDENKYCADCEAKQPRWASWNLGVFLCIRCAGLHRNLGVHISKVKSVNLDSWTPEQVQSMRVMGNAKAKAVYEAELPAMFRRPQSDQTLEAFIRAKYEARRYILRDWQAPAVRASDLPERAGMDNAKSGLSKASSNMNSANPLPIPKSSSQMQSVDLQQPQQQALPQSLLIDFSAPSPATCNAVVNGSLFSTAPMTLTAQNVDEEVLASSAGDLDDFIYGPIVSAPSAPTPNSAATNTEQTNDKKSKADIMALFGNGPVVSQLPLTANFPVATPNAVSFPAVAPNVVNFPSAANNIPTAIAQPPLMMFQHVPYGATTAAMSYTQQIAQQHQMASSSLFNLPASHNNSIMMMNNGNSMMAMNNNNMMKTGFGGATSTTTNSGGVGASGLDDLLGQFKL